MTVGVECGFDRGVSEPLLDDFWMFALGNQERAGGRWVFRWLVSVMCVLAEVGALRTLGGTTALNARWVAEEASGAVRL